MLELSQVPRVTFHLSLNVSDLRRSVAFYRGVFGQEPAKLHDDYAKFEIQEPPVIFSLVPRRPGAGGSLSHVGIRLADTDAVRAFGARLTAASICTQAQEGTVCGYARQNKIGVKDPDGTFWEFYTVEEDVLPEELRPTANEPIAAPAIEAAPIVWEYYITEPCPERIPHPDASLDEVRLTGLFNSAMTDTERAKLLHEAGRVLKPGGKVTTHGLMGNRPMSTSTPKLPGLAALVSRVPWHVEVIDQLRAAGFVGVQAVKFTDRAWFVHDGVEMREVKYVAWRPESQANGPVCEVVYRGPFKQCSADGGHVFPRGRRVTVPQSVAGQLRLGPSADHFIFLDDAEGSICTPTPASQGGRP